MPEEDVSASPWQPISTAPKDGTWFLGRVYLASAYPRGRYCTRSTQWSKLACGWADRYGLWRPTEWRPIKEKK